MRLLAPLALLLVLVCASAATAGTVLPFHTMKVACKSPSFIYHDDCVASYRACSATAANRIKTYYMHNGTAPDVLATRYSRERYGSANIAAFEGGVGGCLSALMAEYDRLYG